MEPPSILLRVTTRERPVGQRHSKPTHLQANSGPTMKTALLVARYSTTTITGLPLFLRAPFVRSTPAPLAVDPPWNSLPAERTVRFSSGMCFDQSKHTTLIKNIHGMALFSFMACPVHSPLFDHPSDIFCLKFRSMYFSGNQFPHS